MSTETASTETPTQAAPAPPAPAAAVAPMPAPPPAPTAASISAAARVRIREEVARRRTFAIISHPDAGKTTLTEKLLLYAGAIETAGMIRSRKRDSRATASDWLAIERERGISVTSSAMQLPYKDAMVTILDTPGHNDFCEDTYRALMAADSAVMVIDAGKGVEAQTLKLFAVCRRRGIPILTFVNKLDLNSRDTLELMTHIEEVLGISTTPMNWPVGFGKAFKGVIDRKSRELVQYDSGHGSTRRKELRLPWDSDEARAALGPTVRKEVEEELELIDVAGTPFDRAAFLEGRQSPVFFGSALQNFGVEAFFDAFVELAPAPAARTAERTEGGEAVIDPVESEFSAFVFKVQANMNPKHHDSMAFLRICSGRFEREMSVMNHRTGKALRLARTYSCFARERQTIEEAFAGDVLGIVNPGAFAIGDTISISGAFSYRGLPQIAPTLLCRIRPREAGGRKSFDKGLEQLIHEGTVQSVEVLGPPRERCVAAVGRLQFEVLQHRLRGEYGVETTLSVEPFASAAWIAEVPKDFHASYAVVAIDSRGRHLVLFRSDFDMRCTKQRYPQMVLSDLS